MNSRILFLFVILNLVSVSSFGQPKPTKIIVNISCENKVSNILVVLMLADSVLALDFYRNSGKVTFETYLDTTKEYKFFLDKDGFNRQTISFQPISSPALLFNLTLPKTCTLGREQKIRFNGNQTKLDDNLDISWLINLFVEYPEFEFEMVYVPIENENKRLYAKRCLFMKKYLVENGIEPKRFSFSLDNSIMNDYCQGCFQPKVK